MNLQGTTALVTGASRGLGRAVALHLAAQGVKVAVNYRHQRNMAELVVAEIRAGGGDAEPIAGDVGAAPEADALVAQTESALGPIDLLVNNAGIFRRSSLDEFSESEFSEMRRVNVDGLVYVTRAAARGMKERGRGRIVNLASIAALGTLMAGTTFYAATKAEVILLTRRFAMELGPFGISVNAIAPGFILTDMVYQNRTAAEADALIADIASRTMLGRTGRPEDIASAVSFLLAQDFLTAQVLTVDGGRTDYISHAG
ncbi:MAG: SDR family oxidoreductase [Bryobacterales bacterium]|nr:SDR family oxidoreductase [Bryobacterales bacterium]